MSNKYVRPLRIQRHMQRYKRNMPSIVVDLIDFLYRLPAGLTLKYPFHKKETEYQPFFIIGCGRSGNTLLRKLLMERAEVVIPPEFPGLGSTIRRFSQVGFKDWPYVVEDVLNRFYDLADIEIPSQRLDGEVYYYNLARELDINFDDLREELLMLRESDKSLAAILSKIYQAYSLKKCGRQVPWGDKTPWNVFHYDRIKKTFPKARYIHILRDGRACVASYVKSLGEQKNISLEDASYRWRDSVLKCLEIGKVEQGRFLTVRYEDLVSNTEAELGRVIGFLNINPQFSGIEGAFPLGDERLSHHSNLSKPVNTDSINRWRESFTREELISVRSILGETLLEVGYDYE